VDGSGPIKQIAQDSRGASRSRIMRRNNQRGPAAYDKDARSCSHGGGIGNDKRHIGPRGTVHRREK
jgi:hypothetical protein